MDSQPATTVVFTTYNRCELLRRAIAAALAQTIKPAIIVCDDASTDGTSEMLAEEFPGATHLRSEKRRGPCFQRNRGIREAKTKTVFPLDDDSILIDPQTIEKTLEEFSAPSIAIVTIPYQNILQNKTVRSKAPDKENVWIAHSFVAAAHAFRRAPFLKVGGYDENLFYMGEEGDLSLRLLAAGYVTRLGNAPPLHHHQPANRISPLAERYGRRNDLLFYYRHTPVGRCWRSLAGTTAAGLLRGIRTRRLPSTLRGLAAGYKEIVTHSIKRQPIDKSIYDLYIQLKRGGSQKLKDIEQLLPDLTCSE